MKKKSFIVFLILVLSLSGCQKESYTSKSARVTFPFEDEVFDVEIEPVSVDEVDKDVEIFAYEFTSDKDTFDYPLEITLPYKAKGLDLQEHYDAVVGKYFNEETKAWEDVNYTVNPEEQTITILTDHFSIYSAFVIKNPNKRAEYISSVNAYKLHMSVEEALKIIESYGKKEENWEENIAKFFLDAANDERFGYAGDTLTVLNLGNDYAPGFLNDLSGSLSNLGLAASSLELAYNLYQNGLSAKESQIDMMKYILNLAVGGASAHIQLAFVGVGLIDTALNKVMTFAVKTKYESTQNMYREYYKRNENRRSATDWYRIFLRIYNGNKDDGKKVMKLIDQEINRYVNEYWDVAGTDWESWIDAYDKNGNLAKYPWPLDDDRINISNHHKDELMSLLQSPLLMLNRKMYYDLYDAKRDALENYARQLNQIITLNFKEDRDDKGNVEFGDAYLALSPLPKTHEKKSWAIKLNSKGEGTLKFTLLAHANANTPMTFDLYKTKEDFDNDKIAKSYTIKQIKNPTSTFTFNKKQKAINFSGTFTGTLTNNKTGKVNKVITTITFKEDWGDGAIYQIHAQNVGSSSYYIKGDYFIRNTGEANIGGAKFVMSKNGQSFEASMLDSQDREWGHLVGSR